MLSFYHPINAPKLIDHTVFLTVNATKKISEIICFLNYLFPILLVSYLCTVNETKKMQFLVACTRLYNPLCRSVGPSVGPSGVIELNVGKRVS